MKKNNSYHLFLFLTTFTRGIVDSFSLVLLYKKGFTIDNILLFLLVTYIVGMIVNYVSLKVNFKVMLVLSGLLYGVSYLYLSFMDTSLLSLVIFAVFLSCSNNSYHCIRHYLAMNCEIKNTSLVVNIMFMAWIVASVIGTLIVSKLSIVVVSIILFSLSLISLLPIFKMSIKRKEKYKKVIIRKRKVIFNIMEQFKVIFLELQPLFLFLYISNSISYVGWFNIVINISSLVVLFFIRKIFINKYFLIISLLLGFVFLFKISVSNSIVLFLVAVIEGILVKLYDRGSLSNLYDINGNSVREYLNMEELIFFGSKSVIMLVFLILGIELKSILFLCLIGVMGSGVFFDKVDE